MSRTSVLWRRWLLALCGFGVLLLCISVWEMYALLGDKTYGIAISPSSTPFVDRIRVEPGSPDAINGLRTGDLVNLRRLSPADRYRWETNWSYHERMVVTVRRGSQTHTVALVADKPFSAQFTSAELWDIAIGEAGALWMLLFAALLAWRRPENAEARVLALILILLYLGAAFDNKNLWTPWPIIDALAQSLSFVVILAGTALFATYAMLFARPASLGRRVLEWLSYLSAAVAAALGIMSVVVVWTLAADPKGALFTSLVSALVESALPLLFPLLCVLASVAATRGADRARITWATASLGFLWAVQLSVNVVGTFDPRLTSTAATLILNVAYFIAPIGLTYSLLNRRLLDVGFAINRAAVFSGVSIVIVGTFILVEWLLSGWLQGQSHTANIAISAALALLLGLSIRVVHTRVDRFVDTVFFRKRHADEKAIRTFASEAAYITDTQLLLGRTAEVLNRHADASSVSILLDDGDAHYGSVSENDPAIVALRARGEVLDLHPLRTELNGEFAYPMVARGRLIGALVLGPKCSGEAYAPDEADAIAQLARNVGTSLHVLAARGDDSRNKMLEAIAALSHQTQILADTTRALPDTLARTLTETISELRRTGV